MTNDDAKPGGVRFSLSRWSERKRASARGEPLPESTPADAPATPTDAPATPADAPATLADASTAPAPPASAANAQTGAAVPVAAATPSSDAPPLPPVESLTFDSDFTVFMTADVDDSVKRSALRKLLRDPRFNVMDGLDTYIDDYSLPDPIAPSMLAQLRHSAATLNPVFDHPQADAAAGAPAEDPAPIRVAARTTAPGAKAATPPRAADAALGPACDDAGGANDAYPEQVAELPAVDGDAALSQSEPSAARPVGDRSGA